MSPRSSAAVRSGRAHPNARWQEGLTRGSSGGPAPGEEDDDDSSSHLIGKAIDVWALGVTLFCFLYGRVPFDSSTSNAFEVYQRIRNEEYVACMGVCKLGDEPGWSRGSGGSGRTSNRGRQG